MQSVGKRMARPIPQGVKSQAQFIFLGAGANWWSQPRVCMESQWLLTARAPRPSESSHKVVDIPYREMFSAHACVCAPPKLKQDHDYLKKASVHFQHQIIICDWRPIGIGMAPDLLKVCRVRRESWSWAVDAAALGAAQSRGRKVRVFTRWPYRHVDNLAIFHFRRGYS